MAWFVLEYLFLWSNFTVKYILQWHTITTPWSGYIDSDFRSDFSQKSKIPIFYHSLKMVIQYHKNYEGPFLGFAGCFLKFWAYLLIHLYMLYPSQVPNFSQFCEKMNHKNFVISYLRSLLNLCFISAQNCDEGFIF